eukprot:TRINITY_DN2392_c0_g1_i2.p1 TRINITY_DN2392_c0_g1~~TRINITY_DN2392_c0_g1_i2.p1  ORF type:complete len:103 (-),score=10.41 TRINITY_DN2392_c0_g1_i2:66-374(-)
MIDGKFVYTRAEVGRHDRPTDAWIIIDKGVYNITSWMGCKSGWEEPLTRRPGRDASETFRTLRHSITSPHELREFLIGFVEDEPRYTLVENARKPVEAFRLE